MTDQEQQLFGHLIHPDDSYTRDGVYWADLPLRKRVAFVSKVDRQETKRELAEIGRMFKKNPFSLVRWYWANSVIPGAGLLLESYVLFSVGLLGTLFASVWPQCWGSSHETCSKDLVASVIYLEIVGIMAGQVVVGVSSPTSPSRNARMPTGFALLTPSSSLETRSVAGSA